MNSKEISFILAKPSSDGNLTLLLQSYYPDTCNGYWSVEVDKAKKYGTKKEADKVLNNCINSKDAKVFKLTIIFEET